MEAWERMESSKYKVPLIFRWRNSLPHGMEVRSKSVLIMFRIRKIFNNCELLLP